MTELGFRLLGSKLFLALHHQPGVGHTEDLDVVAEETL